MNARPVDTGPRHLEKELRGPARGWNKSLFLLWANGYCLASFSYLHLTLSLAQMKWLHSDPSSSLPRSLHLFLMRHLLPTVPCKCHNMAAQRRKKGQSAGARGQSWCASKAVKTELYGWSLSNSHSQFTSCCMLQEKTTHLVFLLVHTREASVGVCVLVKQSRV